MRSPLLRLSRRVRLPRRRTVGWIVFVIVVFVVAYAGIELLARL